MLPIGIVLTLASVNRGAFQTLQRPVQITFADSIAPLLKRNCSPCHFEGGEVFARLPFEKYETVRGLGKKLKTRLRGENAAIVDRWIAGGFQK